MHSPFLKSFSDINATSSRAGPINLQASDNQGCHGRNHIEDVLQTSLLVVASAVIVLLNLAQLRRQHCKKLPWSLPGLVVPVNVVGGGGGGFRLIYCVVLGCLGADLLNNVMDLSLYFSSYQYSILDAVDFFMFSPTVLILKLSLIYFPVFACVDSAIPVLGHVVGLIYTCLLASTNIYSEYVLIQGCTYRGNQSNRDIGISLGTQVPIYVLYLVIAGWFFCHMCINTVLLLSGSSMLKFSVMEKAGFKAHVKQLLRKPTKPFLERVAGRFLPRSVRNDLVKGLEYVLPQSSFMRFPLPFLGALVMSYIVLFQLVVICSAKQIIWMQDLEKWLGEFNITVKFIEKILPETKGRLDRTFADVLTFARAYKIILPLGSIGALAYCWIFSAYMIQNVHKQLSLAARGDKTFLMKSEPLPSLSYRLAATMKFSAFQVAFLILTWIIYCIVLWILCTIGLFFFYAFKDYRHDAIHIWSWAMVPMMWGAALHHVQLFLCKYVFLDKKQGRKLIGIRYKWLYQLLAYFLFFFNVIFGVVMCFLRILGVVVFTLVMLCRLDWDVYMRGLEGWDIGNRTYVGYIYMEHTYNNPVVHTFIALLREAAHKNSLTGGGSSNNTANGFVQSGEVPLQRARNRWLVAYTILHNPSLAQWRA